VNKLPVEISLLKGDMKWIQMVLKAAFPNGKHTTAANSF
jgi:hypothetical protein